MVSLKIKKLSKISFILKKEEIETLDPCYLFLYTLIFLICRISRMSWSVGKVELTAFVNNSFHELIFCGWVLKTVEELFTVVEVEWIYVIVFLLNRVECE